MFEFIGKALKSKTIWLAMFAFFVQAASLSGVTLPTDASTPQEIMTNTDLSQQVADWITLALTAGIGYTRAVAKGPLI
jgi:hypothetical protein